MRRILKSSTIWLTFLIIAILTAACAEPTPDEPLLLPVTGENTLQVTSSADSPIPSKTPTPAATTPSTATQTPTVTPTPTITPHPMSIPALRQMNYPGSEIIFEETLEPGANYNRYYVSYMSEGLKQYGLLTIPFGETPPTGWPAIVFNHGYIPPSQYRTTERYIAYVDSLAQHGYIVFRIDYRGHDRSEGIPAGAYGSPGYTIDVLNAVSTLKQFPPADNNRIGMWGHSMGGFLTLRAMVISEDIKAGSIWAGVVGSYSDLFSRWRRGNSDGPTPTPLPTPRFRWRSLWADSYGTPNDNPEFWDTLSSNSYVGDISGPVQLHHGTGDETVPVEFSELLYQELQEAGKTVELYTYPGDNHNISNSFGQAMTRTILFYDQYLKGEE